MQSSLSSREKMEQLSRSGRWSNIISPELASFLSAQTSIFFGTASVEGQPYIQHRGGAPGFIRVLDNRTLSFDEVPGNQQYISFGNLAENNRAVVFAIDYSTRTRIKLWGRAKLEGVERFLSGEGSPTIFFTVEAWDRNCKKLIPELWPIAAVKDATQSLLDKISKLQAQVTELELELARAAGGDA